MNPSHEALELLHEERRIIRARPIFTERRRARRFWNAWAVYVAAALVILMYLAHKGLV